MLVIERYACSQSRRKGSFVIWNGYLKEISAPFPNVWKHLQSNTEIIIREDEYFLDYFQSEKSILHCSFTCKEAFDMNKLNIHSQVDHLSGIVLTDKSFSYDNRQITAEWTCDSAQPYPPTLRRGLSHMLSVTKLDTGERFRIDPDTKAWHLELSTET